MKGQKITALLVLIAMLFQCTVPVFAETVPEYPSGTSTAEHTDAGQPLPEETQAPEQTDPEEIFTMEISEEATALYVDGDLTAITTEGDKLRDDLDAMKAPFENPDDPNQRVEFTKDVEVVDGIYFTDSITRYDRVKEKITGLEQAEVLYTVVEGDTPWNIARRNDLTIDQLYALNPQMNEKGYNMFIGDQLVIGQERQYLPVKVIHTVTYEEEVPFETLTTESGDYDWGSIRTIVQGVPGLKEVTADIT